MRKLLAAGVIALAGSLFLTHDSHAQGKVSAYLFGDYFWYARHHDTAFDNQNGFWVRRIYLTYDSEIDEHFSARLRLEMNQKDFATAKSTKMEPFIKDAYLKWKHDRHSVLAGISGTPTWGVVEKTWGYRWVEKTPLDLLKFGSSRDFGLVAKGNLDAEKKFGYHLMLGQGNSTGHETDKGKKYYLSLNARPTGKLLLEVYGDIEDSEGDVSNTASYVLQVFASLENENGRVGLLYAYNVREQGTGANDAMINLASLYAVAKLREDLSAFVRLDYLADPNPSAAGISYVPMAVTRYTTFVLAGLDLKASEKVRVSPNVEVVAYGRELSSGLEPDTDVITRLTLFFKF